MFAVPRLWELRNREGEPETMKLFTYLLESVGYCYIASS